MIETNRDLESARKRVEAWWNGAGGDRPVLLVTAPRRGARAYDGPDTDDLHRYFTDWAARPTLQEINLAWREAWRQLSGICHRLGGWFFWMRIWSDRPAVDLQSDVSCLVSREFFDEYFLPVIEQQTAWAERTIYHLDGPGAIRHLDSLLALPRLTAIQWVPGAGAPGASHWIPLAKRIQAAGKRLFLDCEPGEVETLARELHPGGLILSTRCAGEEEARALLASLRICA